jgi:CRP-like cAMP-binding protein
MEDASMTNATADARNRLAILSSTGFFGGLSDSQLEQISALCELQERGDGEQIYRVGEPARVVYVVVRGMVRLAVGYGERSASGGNVLRRGDVFGWAALTPACNQRIATASCMSACSLLTIDGASLLALMERDHTLGYRLMSQLNRLITSTLSAFAGG